MLSHKFDPALATSMDLESRGPISSANDGSKKTRCNDDWRSTDVKVGAGTWRAHTPLRTHYCEFKPA